MPVLARTLEEMGVPTVLITNMPYWAEKIGAPRTLAVEHPFGQPIGFPHDVEGQLQVLRLALSLFEKLTSPGQILEVEDTWPVEVNEAVRLWQPGEPSPIIRQLSPRIRDLIRHRGQFRA
jgi:hypothetical protein